MGEKLVVKFLKSYVFSAIIVCVAAYLIFFRFEGVQLIAKIVAFGVVVLVAVWVNRR